MNYGYFDNANREYVVAKVSVPVSWGSCAKCYGA